MWVHVWNAWWYAPACGSLVVRGRPAGAHGTDHTCRQHRCTLTVRIPARTRILHSPRSHFMSAGGATYTGTCAEPDATHPWSTWCKVREGKRGRVYDCTGKRSKPGEVLPFSPSERQPSIKPCEPETSLRSLCTAVCVFLCMCSSWLPRSEKGTGRSS